MTIKVTYNVTDIYVSESVSATYINVSYETPTNGGAVWGDITGTLSNQTDLQAALDAKVPYTGATANVDLGEWELKAGQLELDQSPTGTAGVAVTRWNASLGTIETTLNGGNVVLKHGRDMFERVVNKTGIQLTKAAYQAVRISDAQGQRLAVQLAQANNDNNSADTIGLVVETIDNNQEGYIYTVGEIDGVNTTGTLQGETWVDGDVLYLSPTIAGRITNVKPIAPQHLVIIGYVVYAHQNNGKIYVKVMNGWELGELHDVNTTGATNGQVLKYNGTIWVPSSDTGITTLNTLTALSQTFATGTSGTDFNISSATSTHTFNLPSASATNRGLLTSADWTTFNNKQNALTNPVTGTGVSGQVSYWSGTNTQTGSNNLFWDATNNRLGIGTNIPNRQLVIYDGASGVPHVQWANASTGVTNADGFQIRLLSTNQVHFTNFENSAMYFGNQGITGQMTLYPSGNLAIGTSASDSTQRLQVIGDTLLRGTGATSATTALTVQNSDSANLFRVRNDGATLYGQSGAYIATIAAGTGSINSAGAGLGFLQNDGSSGGRSFLYSGASIVTTSGVRNNIQVLQTFAPTSGTAVFNNLALEQTINQTGGANGITRGLFVTPTLTAAADWRSIEWSNNTGWGLYGAGTSNNYLGGRLAIGSTNFGSSVLAVRANLTGTTSQAGVLQSGTVLSDVTNTVRGFLNQLNTQAAAFSLFEYYHFDATQGTIGASSSVSNQYGFRAADSLTGATNNFGFYGNIPSGTGRWNLYMNGTAANFISGDTQIGTGAFTSEKLQVNGTMRVTGASTFGGAMTLSLNQNAETSFSISNTTAGTGSISRLNLISDSTAGSARLFKYSSLNTGYKTIAANDFGIFNITNGDISILNDFASGSIKMAAGGSSTAHMTIKSNGRINMSSLPTSSAGLSAGDLWNDGGTLKIV